MIEAPFRLAVLLIAYPLLLPVLSKFHPSPFTSKAEIMALRERVLL